MNARRTGGPDPPGSTFEMGKLGLSQGVLLSPAPGEILKQHQEGKTREGETGSTADIGP